MINITLLKVKHARENEARKLIPYIKIADIFSLENAAVTESEASLGEAGWRDTLSLNINRSQLNNKGIIVLPGSEEYAKSVRLYLYRNRKPIVNLERHTPEKAKAIMNYHNSSLSQEAEALSYLLKGQITTFMYTIQEVIQSRIKMDELRDQEIAKNVKTIEGLIRKDNPQLRQKDPIILTGFIGSCHSPEKYEPSIKTENLTVDKNLQDKYETTAFGRKLPFQEMELLILQWGLYTLRTGININIVGDIEQMDYTTLVKEAEKLKKDYPI